MKKPIRKGLLSALFAAGLAAFVLAYEENARQAFVTVGHGVERVFEGMGGVGQSIGNVMRGLGKQLGKLF